MFAIHIEGIDDRYSIKMIYKQFDRNGFCQILNTFEGIGYFGYDPIDYQFVVRMVTS